MNAYTLREIRDRLASKKTDFVAFFTHYLRPKRITLVSPFPLPLTQLHLSPSLTCPPITSSFSFPSYLSSLPFSYLTSLRSSSSSSSSFPSLSSLSPATLTSSLHRYLLNPSPLFLPCLLVVFLLVVMLTASQSLALALILATPLGLTLWYLESVVSGQRRAVLPMVVSEKANDGLEGQLSSGFNKQASPMRTPPRIRHHTSATWMPDMCDPAA